MSDLVKLKSAVTAVTAVTSAAYLPLTELAIGAQRTAGEGRTVLGRTKPKSETIRDYNLKVVERERGSNPTARPRRGALT
eukprot:scaffold14054_cov30-Phaeocystis_antarctica.AAC.2